VIASKSSDLQWQVGSLPEPIPGCDHVLLAWIAGSAANHLTKVFQSEGEWRAYYHIPVHEIGIVHYWCVLRDEP